MLILARDTLWNRAALDSRIVANRALGRVTLWPRGAGAGIVARLIFEVQVLGYLLALTPIIVSMFIWQDLALPIAHAPVPMLIVIGLVEMKVLRMTESQRRALLDPVDADRMRDALQYRVRDALARIAAARGWQTGEATLVIEQSELARIAPLTLVSLHHGAARPAPVDLSAAERALLAEAILPPGFDERALQRLNWFDNAFVRRFAFDPRSLTAHAILEAQLARPPAPGGGRPAVQAT